MLLTFGGHSSLDMHAARTAASVAQLAGWVVVQSDARPLAHTEACSLQHAVSRDTQSGVVSLRLAMLRRLYGVRFVDVVNAVDLIITKPGYGIVSEIM